MAFPYVNLAREDIALVEHQGISTIEEAIEDLRNGKMIILMDDEDRENEGDLVLAAEKVTPDAITFMATYGRGLICLALTPEKVDALDLPMMTQKNESRFGTGFTVSVDAKEGITTGISAYDRAKTILTAISPDAKPEDLVRPGHIFPLRASHGGVLTRAGQTEGSVDLARLAGLYPAAVICEVMKEDGTMARLPDLLEFGRSFDIKVVTIADLIRYRLEREVLIKRIERKNIETAYGSFYLTVYQSMVDDLRHLGLVKGKITKDKPVLVYVHRQCIVGDVFHAKECNCGGNLTAALERISREGEGVIVYLTCNSLDLAICGSEENIKKGFFELREYGIGAQILRDLGLGKLRIITSNLKKIVGLKGYGLEVTEQLIIGRDKFDVPADS